VELQQFRTRKFNVSGSSRHIRLSLVKQSCSDAFDLLFCLNLSLNYYFFKDFFFFQALCMEVFPVIDTQRFDFKDGIISIQL